MNRPWGEYTPAFTEIVVADVASYGPYKNRTLQIDYTNLESVADEFATLYLSECHEVGFDLEHKPTRMKGEKKNLSLIQLAPRYNGLQQPVLLFSLFHNNGELPDCLAAVLRDRNKKKYGVGVWFDLQILRYLNLSWHSRQSFVDLALEAFEAGQTDNKSLGLKALTEHYMGEACTEYKTKDVTKSDWSEKDLTEEQIQYAAMDAFVGLQIHMCLDREDGRPSRYQRAALRLRR